MYIHRRFVWKNLRHTRLFGWCAKLADTCLSICECARKQGTFCHFAKTIKKASEVTLQPVDILGVDAAILFSDILVVPLEMGMDLRFEKGEGPVFTKPLRDEAALDALSIERSVKSLAYVYDTIKLTRENLAKDKALIGFCGAPWTIATYMIEGGGSKNYAICKRCSMKIQNFCIKF